ncbi:10921_t:CDS:1, partial [Funneliformis geosporum]
VGYLIDSSGLWHVKVKDNKKIKTVYNYSFDVKDICLKVLDLFMRFEL